MNLYMNEIINRVIKKDHEKVFIKTVFIPDISFMLCKPVQAYGSGNSDKRYCL